MQPVAGRAIAESTVHPSMPVLFSRRHVDLQRVAGALCLRGAR